MSSAVSPASSAASAAATLTPETNDAKVQEAATSVRLPLAKALAIWATATEGSPPLKDWFLQDLKDNKGEARSRILSYSTDPASGILDLSDLKGFEKLPPEVLDLPGLTALKLSRTVALASFNYAVTYNDAKMCSKLLRLVPDIKREEFDRSFTQLYSATPLGNALKNKREELAQELLYGISKDKALQVAAKVGHAQFCEQLMKEGVSPFSGQITPLEYAAATGHLAVVQKMLPQIRTLPDLDFVASALYRTMKLQRDFQEELAKELLRYLKGAEALNLWFDGNTLLTLAARTPAWNPLIPLLLECGADATIQDGDGASALFILTTFEDAPVEEILVPLLEQTAAQDLQDSAKWTALMMACHRGHKKAVLQLLQKGADPNVGPPYTSALLLAIEKADTPLAKILLAYGARWNPDMIYDYRGGELTLLEMAKENNMSEVIQLLEEALPAKQAASPKEEASLSDID